MIKIDSALRPDAGTSDINVSISAALMIEPRSLMGVKRS